MREYKAMKAAERYVGGWGKRKKRVQSSALEHTICWMRARVSELTRYACVACMRDVGVPKREQSSKTGTNRTHPKATRMTQTARPFPAEYTKLDAQARLTLHIPLRK